MPILRELMNVSASTAASYRARVVLECTDAQAHGEEEARPEEEAAREARPKPDGPLRRGAGHRGEAGDDEHSEDDNRDTYCTAD